MSPKDKKVPKNADTADVPKVAQTVSSQDPPRTQYSQSSDAPGGEFSTLNSDPTVSNGPEARAEGSGERTETAGGGQNGAGNVPPMDQDTVDPSKDADQRMKVLGNRTEDDNKAYQGVLDTTMGAISAKNEGELQDISDEASDKQKEFDAEDREKAAGRISTAAGNDEEYFNRPVERGSSWSLHNAAAASSMIGDAVGAVGDAITSGMDLVSNLIRMTSSGGLSPGTIGYALGTAMDSAGKVFDTAVENIGRAQGIDMEKLKQDKGAIGTFRGKKYLDEEFALKQASRDVQRANGEVLMEVLGYNKGPLDPTTASKMLKNLSAEQIGDYANKLTERMAKDPNYIQAMEHSYAGTPLTSKDRAVLQGYQAILTPLRDQIKVSNAEIRGRAREFRGLAQDLDRAKRQIGADIKDWGAQEKERYYNSLSPWSQAIMDALGGAQAATFVLDDFGNISPTDMERARRRLEGMQAGLAADDPRKRAYDYLTFELNRMKKERNISNENWARMQNALFEANALPVDRIIARVGLKDSDPGFFDKIDKDTWIPRTHALRDKVRSEALSIIQRYEDAVRFDRAHAKDVDFKPTVTPALISEYAAAKNAAFIMDCADKTSKLRQALTKLGSEGPADERVRRMIENDRLAISRELKRQAMRRPIHGQAGADNYGGYPHYEDISNDNRFIELYNDMLRKYKLADVDLNDEDDSDFSKSAIKKALSFKELQELAWQEHLNSNKRLEEKRAAEKEKEKQAKESERAAVRARKPRSRPKSTKPRRTQDTAEEHAEPIAPVKRPERDKVMTPSPRMRTASYTLADTAVDRIKDPNKRADAQRALNRVREIEDEFKGNGAANEKARAGLELIRSYDKGHRTAWGDDEWDRYNDLMRDPKMVEYYNNYARMMALTRGVYDNAPATQPEMTRGKKRVTDRYVRDIFGDNADVNDPRQQAIARYLVKEHGLRSIDTTPQGYKGTIDALDRAISNIRSGSDREMLNDLRNDAILAYTQGQLRSDASQEDRDAYMRGLRDQRNLGSRLNAEGWGEFNQTHAPGQQKPSAGSTVERQQKQMKIDEAEAENKKKVRRPRQTKQSSKPQIQEVGQVSDDTFQDNFDNIKDDEWN